MEMMTAMTALSALAHKTRLDIFRTLVQAGDAGRLPGEMAVDLAISPTTLSNNLRILTRSGLIRPQPEGRRVRYFAEIQEMRALLAYLTEDGCGGHPGEKTR